MVFPDEWNSSVASYVKLNNEGFVIEAAEKIPISKTATVGLHYYKHGSDFVRFANETINLGLSYKNKKCGSFGDISTFSFYANKQVTTGEGGMISVNSLQLYKKCCSLRNLCFGKSNRFNHDDLGWNYRMTNIQAALGLSQLKNINNVVKKKMSVGRQYFQKLKKNKNLQILPPSNLFAKNIYWIVGIVIKNKKIKTKNMMKKLLRYGIQTRPFFWPMSEQKIFRKLKIFDKANYPNSKYLSEYGFYLPSYLKLNNKEIDYICSVVNKLMK